MSVTCALWELLWHRLVHAAAGFDDDGFIPHDCAWAYEFEGMTGVGNGFKQTDVVVHLRDAVGRERLLVVEIKRRGDKLKTNRDRPDTSPGSYLDLPAFQCVADRRLVYLVDATYEPVVRARVDPTDTRWGVLTWQAFHRILLDLASRLPQPLGLLMRACVEVAMPGSTAHAPLTDARLRATEKLAAGLVGLAPHLQNFAVSAVHFLRLKARLPTSGPPFDYLEQEPSFALIHGFSDTERQRTRDRRVEHWKLPVVARAAIGSAEVRTGYSSRLLSSGSTLGCGASEPV